MIAYHLKEKVELTVLQINFGNDGKPWRVECCVKGEDPYGGGTYTFMDDFSQLALGHGHIRINTEELPEDL